MHNTMICPVIKVQPSLILVLDLESLFSTVQCKLAVNHMV